MVNRSCNQQVHRRRSTGNRNHTRNTKTFFLPMFCRLSINDVAKPTKLADLSCSSSSSISSSPYPTSPEISCIGQIKKRSSNSTITSYNLTTTKISATTTGKSATNLNYTKLRKLFSSKNLISPPIDSTKINNHGSKCTLNRNWICNGSVTRPISAKRKHVISIEDPELMKAVVVEDQQQQPRGSVVSNSHLGYDIVSCPNHFP